MVNHGCVRMAKQPHYRDKTIKDKKHPRIEGYTNIQVCSNTKRGKEVSPMCLGPVKNITEYEDATNRKLLPYASLFENFYQGLKCHTFEINQTSDKILPIYYKRRKKNFADLKPHRRVYPKKLLLQKNAKVEFTYYNKRRYTWIEARKEIYCKIYAEMVQKTKYFQELKQRLNDGENLLIIGYDGFEFDTNVIDAKFRALMHLNDTSKSVGHEFVICCLLVNLTPWEAQIT
jgi:hypothetical protein